MENFDYWVSLYSWIFTILIASLSVNSIFFIKGFLNKLLYFFIFTRLYAFILTFFFESASIGYTQQELLPMFIYKGYKEHIFQSNIAVLTSMIAILFVLIRFLSKWKNYRQRKNE